jgi:hypothetical protein
LLLFGHQSPLAAYGPLLTCSNHTPDLSAHDLHEDPGALVWNLSHFRFISAIMAQFDFTYTKNQLAPQSWNVIWQPH